MKLAPLILQATDSRNKALCARRKLRHSLVDLRQLVSVELLNILVDLIKRISDLVGTLNTTSIRISSVLSDTLRLGVHFLQTINCLKVTQLITAQFKDRLLTALPQPVSSFLHAKNRISNIQRRATVLSVQVLNVADRIPNCRTVIPVRTLKLTIVIRNESGSLSRLLLLLTKRSESVLNTMQTSSQSADRSKRTTKRTGQHKSRTGKRVNRSRRASRAVSKNRKKIKTRNDNVHPQSARERVALENMLNLSKIALQTIPVRANLDRYRIRFLRFTIRLNLRHIGVVDISANIDIELNTLALKIALNSSVKASSCRDNPYCGFACN